MILGESKEETIARLVADWDDGHIDADVLLMCAYEAGYIAGATATLDKLPNPPVLVMGEKLP
jgi:hypothetical protein